MACLNDGTLLPANSLVIIIASLLTAQSAHRSVIIMGRLKKVVDVSRVKQLLQSGLSKSRVAAVMKISRPLLYRRVKRNNISTYQSLTDAEIDTLVTSAQNELPSFGERMVLGYLRSKGVNVGVY